MEKLFVSQIELKPKGNSVVLLEITCGAATRRGRGSLIEENAALDCTVLMQSLYILYYI